MFNINRLKVNVIGILGKYRTFVTGQDQVVGINKAPKICYLRFFFGKGEDYCDRYLQVVLKLY